MRSALMLEVSGMRTEAANLEESAGEYRCETVNLMANLVERDIANPFSAFSEKVSNVSGWALCVITVALMDPLMF